MADEIEKENLNKPRLLIKGRTWDFLLILVYGLLLSLYASVVLGVVFGVGPMIAAIAVAIPALILTWTTVLVLLTFCGKSRKVFVLERRKITADITGLAIKIYLKKVVPLLLLGICF
ncbi:hypothetical protein MKX01_026723 [Papaver californicum]|nr:hypothetical protein MKX01_026723 [Papaver californicum]